MAECPNGGGTASTGSRTCKFVVREEPRMKGPYFRQFTYTNIAFLAVLLVFALILG
nr:hypothetical protein [uncultured Oscillibacter sp.]